MYNTLFVLWENNGKGEGQGDQKSESGVKIRGLIRNNERDIVDGERVKTINDDIYKRLGK